MSTTMHSVNFTLWGKNLTDEEWKEQALFLGGPNTGFQGWGPPRTYALQIEYRCFKVVPSED